MWKVIAVIVNVTSPACGLDLGVGCHIVYKGADISHAQFYNFEECTEYADFIRDEHARKGEVYNTFCAKFHE